MALDAGQIRGIRAEEQWVRYDSICIGPGASKVSPSWFENFEDFARADTLSWGTSTRSSSVGSAYNNQGGEAPSWAQKIYQTGVDFIAPMGFMGFEKTAIEAGLLQAMFIRDLPERMAFNVNVGDVDTVLQVSGGMLPGSSGVTGQSMNGAGFLVADAGQRGTADMRNTWSWPHPLEIPAKMQLEVKAQIANPLKGVLQQMSSLPTSKALVVPGEDGSPPKTIEYPNWYQIKVWHKGPRYVQLRGARSSS